MEAWSARHELVPVSNESVRTQSVRLLVAVTANNYIWSRREAGATCRVDTQATVGCVERFMYKDAKDSLLIMVPVDTIPVKSTLIKPD